MAHQSSIHEYDFGTSTPRPDWLEHLAPLIPILQTDSIPVLVWGGDALCIQKGLAGSDGILQIVVPDASQLRIAAGLLEKDYETVHDPASSEHKPCISTWMEVVMIHQGCDFAFPAETTITLKERANNSSPPHTRPRYIFFYASAIVHIDMSDESRTCTLAAVLPPNDPRRKLQFLTLTTLYDSLIDTGFEPPRPFRHRALDGELNDVLHSLIQHSHDSESDESSYCTSDESDVVQKSRLVNENGTGCASILKGIKEENRPYLNRLFRTLGLWTPSWDNVAQERMQLKRARLSVSIPPWP